MGVEGQEGLEARGTRLIKSEGECEWGVFMNEGFYAYWLSTHSEWVSVGVDRMVEMVSMVESFVRMMGLSKRYLFLHIRDLCSLALIPL